MSDARLEIILAAKDLTGKAFDHVTGRLMALERRVFSLGSAFAGFGLGFGASQLAAHVEKTAEGFEVLEAQLDILYRGNGKQVLEEINAWALDMPINTQKAVDAFVQMKALGLEPTLDRLQTLTDVATIFGDDVLKRIVLQLGQMSSKGKVMAQDLNVLAESGINARKYLMDAFGMTVEEIQDSGIEISKVVEVLFKGMERDFGGSATRMMNSWRGLKETAASYFVEIERKVMDAGLFDAMKKGLADFNGEMKNWLAHNDALLKQKVPEYTAQVIESAKSLYGTTAELIGLYQSLPDEVAGAAGYGILGRVLFGGWGPAKIIAGIALVNNAMADYGLGLGDLKRKNDEAGAAVVEFGRSFWQVLSGQRNWWTGEYTEWKKAADTATDFWQRHKQGAESYQEDIRRILENDPLNDFFSRQKNQMGYYTSPAGKALREMAQDEAKAKSGKGVSVNEKFWEEYKKEVEGGLAFERQKLAAQLKEFEEYVSDKAAIARWYAAEKRKLDVKEYSETALAEFPAEHYGIEAERAKAYKANQEAQQAYGQSVEEQRRAIAKADQVGNDERWWSTYVENIEDATRANEIFKDSMDIMSQSAADALAAMALQTGSVKDAFNSLVQSVVAGMIRMSTQQGAEALFGTCSRPAARSPRPTSAARPRPAWTPTRPFPAAAASAASWRSSSTPAARSTAPAPPGRSRPG